MTMTNKTQTRLLWTARILELCGALAGGAGGYSVLTGGAQGWLALVAWALAMIAGRIRQWLPGADGAAAAADAKKVAAGAIVLALALVVAACSPFAAAWRTTAAVKQAGTVTASALAAALDAKSKACLEKHKAKTAEYATCVKPELDAARGFLRYGKPAINSAIALTVGAILLAEKAGEKPEGGAWIELIRPAFCALTRAVAQWGAFMGDARSQVEGVLKLATGAVCPGGK